jgi:hypothetical protein
LFQIHFPAFPDWILRLKIDILIAEISGFDSDSPGPPIPGYRRFPEGPEQNRKAAIRRTGIFGPYFSVPSSDDIHVALRSEQNNPIPNLARQNVNYQLK